MASQSRRSFQPRAYRDVRPYPEPPESLADLTGPTVGIIELPIVIDWGPRRRYDLGKETDRRIVYERVLREAATPQDLVRFVNAASLIDIWNRLWLPIPIRLRWEERFPELSAAA